MKKLLALAGAAAFLVGCSESNDQGTAGSMSSRPSGRSTINEPSGSATSTNLNTNANVAPGPGSSSSSAPSGGKANP